MNKFQQLIDRVFFNGEITRLADDNLRLIAIAEAAQKPNAPKLRKILTHMANIAIEEIATDAYEWSAYIAGELVDRGQRSTAGDAQRDAVRAILSHITQQIEL